MSKRDVSLSVNPDHPEPHFLRQSGQPVSAFYVTLVIVIALVGVLHRGALTTPWADDRTLGADPAWFQLAAPMWHSVIPGSTSISNALTRLLDPLTSASVTGDARAVAALLTALGAATLLMLYRAAVPLGIGAFLCFSLAGAVLPVTAATSVAHALQVFLAGAMLVVWSNAYLKPGVRLATLSAITVAGVLNHAAFLAFAAGVWVAEWRYVDTQTRARTAVVAVAALSLGLFSTAWLLQVDGASAGAVSPRRPETLAIAVAVITGRFASGLQPLSPGSLREALAMCLPGSPILCAPLAIVGCVAPQTRRLAIACLSSVIGVLMFASGTWLPDLAIATAPARFAVLVLMALGLTWLWRQAQPGSPLLALCVGAFVGSHGFVGEARAIARHQSAEMQSFVESAQAYIGRSHWNAERLATARAMLMRDNVAFRDARMSSGLNALGYVAGDEPLVTLTESDTRVLRDGTFLISRELPHDSAASFLSSQPEGHWLGVALRGAATGDFCRSLLDRFGVTDLPASSTGHAVLARLGGSNAATISAGQRLEVAYGDNVDGYSAPAHFQIETDPAAQIAVNGVASSRATDGMVLTVFDSWRANERTWVVGDCRRPLIPSITERRLRAAVVVESNGIAHLPNVPVVTSTEIEVPLGEDGNEWFGPGWHGPEAQPMRWTAARDADVHVIISHQQTLRVQMVASPAAQRPGANSLSVSWNGALLSAPTIDAQGQREWVIAKPLVRRGMNVLTVHVAELVSPAASGHGADARLLGASVRRLSFIPTPAATGEESSTGRR